jgi:hypothetical protein
MLMSAPSVTMRALLEEHDWIVAADGGAQETGNIQSRGGHDDAQAGAMRENRFAALAVIDGAASQIAANRDAKDNRRLEDAVRAPAHDAEFVADLHHGGPDVVEELNFGYGLETASGHANATADNRGFGERRIENSVSSVLALEAGSGLEDAALPF